MAGFAFMLLLKKLNAASERLRGRILVDVDLSPEALDALRALPPESQERVKKAVAALLARRTVQQHPREVVLERIRVREVLREFSEQFPESWLLGTLSRRRP